MTKGCLIQKRKMPLYKALSKKNRSFKKLTKPVPYYPFLRIKGTVYSSVKYDPAVFLVKACKLKFLPLNNDTTAFGIDRKSLFVKKHDM